MATTLLYPWLIAVSATLVQGLYDYKTNCSLPEAGAVDAKFVQTPNVRGTMDIVWSCAGTMIACVYTVLHYNLPPDKHAIKSKEDPWVRFGLTYLDPWIWPVLTLLAPEMAYTISINQYFAARTSLHRLRAAEKDAGLEWSIVHMLFADMGGFVLLYRTKESQEVLDHARVSDPSDTTQLIPMVHLDVPSQSPAGVSSPSPLLSTYYRYHLTAETYRQAIREKLLPAKPVPLADIECRSKSSWFEKLLLLLQLLQFSVTIIVRLANKLPVSPLEVSTSAFVICSVLTYGFSFPRPRSPAAPVILQVYDQLPSELRTWQKLDRPECSRLAFNDDDETTPYIMITCTLGLSVIFGAIHLAGWHLPFGTKVDTWLWRASSLATVALPITMFSIALLAAAFDLDFDTGFLAFLTLLPVPLYVFARLILIVQTFRTLAYLPPEAFLAPRWPLNIPHFS